MKETWKNLSLNEWFEPMTCVIVAYTPLRLLNCPFKCLCGFVRASDKYSTAVQNAWNISFIVSLWCQFNPYSLVWYPIVVFTSPPRWNLSLPTEVKLNPNLSYFSTVEVRIFHASFAIALVTCTAMISVTWYI